MPNNSSRTRPQFLFNIAAHLVLFAVLAVCGCALAQAQQPAHAAGNASASLPDAPAPQTSTADDLTVRNAPRNFLDDQAALWTSPAHVRARDLEWLMPLAAATGVAFATDQHTMTQVVSRDPSFNQASVDTSNALIGTWIAVPVAVYGFGQLKQDDHAREAGYLSGESMVDALVVGEVLKLASRRERPNVDSANGKFFQASSGLDSSFPSEHSILAWSAASALASEYPGFWRDFTLYSAATSVSLTRVMGQQHFPSDVLVGSSLGWLIGHEVVRLHRHHDRVPSP